MKKIFFSLLCLMLIHCAQERPTNAPQDEALANGDVINKVDLVVPQGVNNKIGLAAPYFSKITVVSNSTDGGPFFVGLEADMHAGYFEFTRNHLQFKNIAGAYKGRESADSTAPIIYQFPITHHNFKLDEVDGRPTNTIVDDNRLPWEQQPQFQIDFSGDASGQFDTRPLASIPNCYATKSRSLVKDSLQMEEDGYFSFVIEVVYDKGVCGDIQDMVQGFQNHTVHFRYSFRRIEQSSYKAWAYEGELDPNMRKFGYFQSVKEEISPVDGRIKNLFLINRWDPRKEHNFYFTKEFPEQYKYIFYNIFRDTSEVFEKAGLTVRFNVRENNWGDGKVKEFGDLRYSFINVVDEISPSGPLGYGPSNANPFTGEIISANLNIYASSLKFYLQILKQSSERNKTKFEDSDLFQKMQALLKEETTADQWQRSLEPGSDLSKLYVRMAQRTIYGWPGWHPYTNAPRFGAANVLMEKASVIGQVENFVMSPTEALTNPKIQVVDEILSYQSSPQGNFVELQLVNTTDFTNDPRYARLAELNKGNSLAVPSDVLSQLNVAMEEYHQKHIHDVNLNRRGHCMYDLEQTMAGAEHLIIDGVTDEQIIENLLYRVGIHEFGHNLSLRHNFYGSVDKDNFNPPSVPMKDNNGNVLTDQEGNPRLWPAVSSSVMDYHRLEDEFHTEQGWEPYDVAALEYLYSDGRLEDQNRSYMFCTDDHTISNALCNRFDLGQSPTEIMMSLIRDYENDYYTVNRRFGRSFWNTSGYNGRILGALMGVKEFLPMWRSSFYSAHLREQAEQMGYGPEATEELIVEMDREIKESIRLSLAFYQAIIQTSNADKPYRNEFSEGTMGSALQRIGIAFDKQVAMYLMMGDDAMFYNPNRVMLFTSYMTYRAQPELAELMEVILENTVTQRVDMDPWFISFGRSLYAQSSMNFYNQEDESFINKIKVKKFSIENLGDYFGIDLPSPFVAETYVLDKAQDPDFFVGEEVAVVLINAEVYMFSVQQNTYAYDIYKNIKQQEEFENPSTISKLDLRELYYIYTLFTGGTL